MKQSKVRVISPPFICGKIMFVKILKYDAPSILAASIVDSGIYFMLCLHRQIPNAENVPGSIIARKLLRSSRLSRTI